MSNLSGRQVCFFGLGGVFLAMVDNCTGQVWENSTVWIRRVEDPKGYWFVVAANYLVSLSFVAYCLY